MKKSPHRSRHFKFVCTLLTLITALVVVTYSGHAQITCYLPGHLSSLTPRWESGQPVTVIYDQNSNFSTAQMESMTKAFKNWNAWNGVWGHNTGVEFVGFEVGAAPNYDTSSRKVHVLKGADNTFTAPAVADWFSFGSGPPTFPG